MGVSEQYLRYPATPSGIKREWCICMYVFFSRRSSNHSQVVLVPADAYDALYRASDRLDDEYEPRSLQRGPSRPKQQQVQEGPKQPPVQTIRNYNKVNFNHHYSSFCPFLNSLGVGAACLLCLFSSITRHFITHSLLSHILLHTVIPSSFGRPLPRHPSTFMFIT
jgi:hypothetical protein